MSDIRVVVTGMGVITPIGNSVEELWGNAVTGKSGARDISYFDASLFKTKFACQIPEFDPKRYLDRNEIKRADLYTQYGLYAASQAMEDAGLDLDKMSPFDIGVIWGSGQGGMNTFEEGVKEYAHSENGPRFNPFFIPKLLGNMASGLISMKFGLQGINYSTNSACATSNSSLMDAFNYIKLGKAKVFVAGGSEAPITEASIGGFNALKALSKRNDSPQTASRPFDVNRDGFVMGEGGAALILEEYEHAKSRGATIYAELAGAAMTADAYHMTATHPEGLGALHAMNVALKEAGVSPWELDYLNAHATSTPVGDISEMKAVSKLLDGKSNKLSISGTKSMTGHLLGAAGALEAIFSIMAIKNNIVPATINTEEIDPQISSDLNIVIQESQSKEVNSAMSNTFGFGGHNAITVFKEI